MAKKAEYDMTPLQVAQVAIERHKQFNYWALSVASTIVSNSFGEKLMEKMNKNNPTELANLENAIAQHLVVCSKKKSAIAYNESDNRAEDSWANDVDRQSGAFSPEEIAATKIWK